MSMRMGWRHCSQNKRAWRVRGRKEKFGGGGGVGVRQIPEFEKRQKTV